MSSQPPHSVSIETVVKRIITHKRISRLDQQLMMAAFLNKDKLSEQELIYVKQVMDGLRSGLIKVVD